MTDNVIRLSVCPLCGKTYFGFPATSEIDHETPICGDCGARQALTRLGVSAEEQEEILRIIHRTQRRDRRAIRAR